VSICERERLPQASATIDAMTSLAGVLMAGALLGSATRPIHFDVTAAFTPARRSAPGEVAVQFVARDPDVKINEVPAPRLKLEAGPATVVPPAPVKGGAGPGHYLDLTLPVTFPVTLAPGTPRGSHDAKGAVTYFYCSKREGWCRKGTAEVAFPITVP
jgi:hypothetical protein